MTATLGKIQYDDLNRLVSLTNTSGTITYGYNSIGNVLTNKESGSNSYVYGSIRPHAVRNANGISYTYDQNGNVANRGGMRLVYDVNNRLAFALTPSNTTSFGYSADGSRLWEQSGTNALQVWIGNNYEEKNGQVLYHVYADGRLIATFDKTGTNVFQYYQPNNLTSTSIQTDTNGTPVQHYEYSAFGQSRYTQSTNTFKVSRRYTSQVLDDATGLYYYNARYYDPVLGRFIQPDDIIPNFADPQSYNRYSYCVNNPLRFTDPSGKWGQEVADAWSGAVNTAFEYYTAGSQSTVLIGTLGTVNSLVGGVTEPLRLGTDAGHVSAEGGSAGKIALTGITEISRAAAIVPVGAAIGKGAGTLAGSLTGSAEREAAGKLVGLGAASRSEFGVRKAVGEMTAAERRAHFISKGVSENELGPSGYPKVHVVEKSTRKETIDAARQAGETKPVKHTQDSGQPSHYHPADSSGNKLTGKDNVHFQKKGSKENP